MAKTSISPLHHKIVGTSDKGGVANAKKEEIKDGKSKKHTNSNTVQIVHIHTASEDFYAIQDPNNSSKYKAVPENLRDQLPPGAKTKAYDASKMSLEDKKKKISVLKQISVSN